MANFVPIQPDPSGAGTEPLVSTLFGQANINLGDMLNTAFLVAVSVGAILAMMRLIWGGYLYMGRSDMWSNKHAAKEVIQNSIIGLLILLAVWIILNQINPHILEVGSFDKSTQNLK